MKERPILFSGEMVRAIIAGRKTKTRRIIKHLTAHTIPAVAKQWGCETKIGRVYYKCPYGQPGDRLWVRETWSEVGSSDPGLIIYKANYPVCVPPRYENIPNIAKIKWKPSIFMPRIYSRITLEITNIRVERLQDISEEDARAEGVPASELNISIKDGNGIYKAQYADLWESINGAGSWDKNPWVWVIEFKRINGLPEVRV